MTVTAVQSHKRIYTSFFHHYTGQLEIKSNRKIIALNNKFQEPDVIDIYWTFHNYKTIYTHSSLELLELTQGEFSYWYTKKASIKPWRLQIRINTEENVSILQIN